MTSIGVIRDRLRAQSARTFPRPEVPAEPPAEIPEVAPEKALLISPSITRAFITAPATVLPDTVQAKWEKASRANEHFLYIQGRFVEADRPNGNGALWTSEDLEIGQPTVANGPLNWLHDEKHIIGVINDSHLVAPQREAAGGSQLNTHIVAQAAVWSFIYPREAAAIQRFSDERRLWYSMECAARSVTCMTCGGEFGHNDAMDRKNVCSHIREGAAIRRFNEPTFLGGAVIVPPVVPGWARADAEVMKEAAAVTERSGDFGGGLEREQVEAMVASILTYAGVTGAP